MVSFGYGVARRLSGDASISKASEGDIAYGYDVMHLASDVVTPETADACTLDALPNPADFIPTESRAGTVIIDEESIGKDDAGNDIAITVATVHGARALVPKQDRALEAMKARFSWPSRHQAPSMPFCQPVWSQAWVRPVLSSTSSLGLIIGSCEAQRAQRRPRNSSLSASVAASWRMR